MDHKTNGMRYVWGEFKKLSIEHKLKEKEIQDTYLALDKSTGYIKIGRSKNPQNRINEFMNANPSIILLATAEVDVERELHIKYAHKNVRGEWFDLSNKDIDNIIFEHCFMIELN